MYSGAVDCRKIALAAVVSLVDVTNRVSVPAYTVATASVGQPQTIRPRIHRKRAHAAIADRIEATCIPEKAAILMAAPPVENRIAAAAAASTPCARFRPLIAKSICLLEPIILVVAFCVQPSPPGGRNSLQLNE